VRRICCSAKAEVKTSAPYKSPLQSSKRKFSGADIVTEVPGLDLMEIQFLRGQSPALIERVGDDAQNLTAHLSGSLAGPTIS